MSEPVLESVGSIESPHDVLVGRFIQFVSELAVDSSLAAMEERLRQGIYTIPQEGPVPFDRLTVSVWPVYSERIEDYYEYSELVIGNGEDQKLKIVCENETFFVDDYETVSQDSIEAEVARVLDWLEATEMHPDAATQRASERLTQPQILLWHLAHAALSELAPHAETIRLKVYDRIFRFMKIEVSGQAVGIDLESATIVPRVGEVTPILQGKRIVSIGIPAANTEFTFGVDRLVARQFVDGKWQDPSSLSHSDTVAEQKEQARLFSDAATQMIYLLDRCLKEDVEEA